MTLSRRTFAFAFAAGAGPLGLGLSTQSPGPDVTEESVRRMLEGQAGASIFDDESWLELLRRALELNAETRGLLRDYELSADVEPAITFLR